MTNPITPALPHSVASPELSLVIPVYNAGATIGPLVEHIHRVFDGGSFEVLLVNDGSRDESERICLGLCEKFPRTVTFVNLARNFGEHSAVLAGLTNARGRYLAVLDDDGQNPPEEVRRLLEELKAKNLDVVYGHYIRKQHSRFRNFGSWFNDTTGLGQIFALFVIAIAAAEVGIGLAIVLLIFRNRETINVDEVDLLKW